MYRCAVNSPLWRTASTLTGQLHQIGLRQLSHSSRSNQPAWQIIAEINNNNMTCFYVQVKEYQMSGVPTNPPEEPPPDSVQAADLESQQLADSLTKHILLLEVDPFSTEQDEADSSESDCRGRKSDISHLFSRAVNNTLHPLKQVSLFSHSRFERREREWGTRTMSCRQWMKPTVVIN